MAIVTPENGVQQPLFLLTRYSKVQISIYPVCGTIMYSFKLLLLPTLPTLAQRAIYLSVVLFVYYKVTLVTYYGETPKEFEVARLKPRGIVKGVLNSHPCKIVKKNDEECNEKCKAPNKNTHLVTGHKLDQKS